MVADAGRCDVGVGGAALSSISAMWRVVMRSRDGGKRFSEMAAGVKRNFCKVRKTKRRRKLKRLKFFLCSPYNVGETGIWISGRGKRNVLK